MMNCTAEFIINILPHARAETNNTPVKLCRGIMSFLSNLANLVNLLVHLSPVVVTILTSTGNSV
jgi:hypothetical protein